MTLFLFTILGIYSAVHVYAFLKVRAAFTFGTWTGILLGIFMVAMICAFILIHVLERQGLDSLSRLISYIGYIWMGVIFLFFFLSLLIDLYHLSVYGAEFILHKDMALFVVSARYAFIIPFFMSLCIALYGYFDALNIRTEKIIIRSQKIPVGTLRIVQISDVHLGLIVRESRLRKIVKVINEEKPDILISTGDLVDGQTNSLAGLAELFQAIQPRYGKFAITGNHEFYAGLPHALEFTRAAGFSMLRNKAMTNGHITIVGIDDPTGTHFGAPHKITEKDLLEQLPKDTFILLLKHQPRIDEGTLGLYDLQLSGHTHKGQIFPFNLITHIFFPHDTGWYDLPKNTHLYVSRGTGTWGPPIRFLASPEITVIDIVHDSQQG